MQYLHTTDLNGILKNVFYKNDPKYYQTKLYYRVSETLYGWAVDYGPFDFGSNKYWVGYNQVIPGFIFFLFYKRERKIKRL